MEPRQRIAFLHQLYAAALTTNLLYLIAIIKEQNFSLFSISKLPLTLNTQLQVQPLLHKTERRRALLYDGLRSKGIVHIFNQIIGRHQGKDQLIQSQLLQRCEFNNFYHEMSSLIVLPIDRYQDSLSTNFVVPQYSVEMTGNTFNGFTNCGSILSNEIELTYLQTPIKNYYFQYEQHQFAVRDYFKFNRYYFSSRYAQWLEPPIQSEILPEYPYTFKVMGNTFRNLNLLKRRFTDNTSVRKESSLTRVISPKLRNLGLILDIRGSIGDSVPIQVKVYNNMIYDINQDFAKWNTVWGSFDHCSPILDNNFAFFRQNVLSQDMGKDTYAQVTHLISIQNNTGSLIVIHNNFMSNISLTGPLIHIQEKAGSSNNRIVIVGNQVHHVFGYVSTNIIHILRQANLDLIIEPTDQYTIRQLQMAKLSFMSGSILIALNSFSEISGCLNAVTAGAIQVGIVHSQTPDSIVLNQAAEIEESRWADVIGSHFENFLEMLYDRYEDYLYLELPDGYPVGFFRHKLSFWANRFTNISMGVSRNSSDGSYELKGALIKLVNVPKTEMIENIFENIGGYTMEHHKDIIRYIFGAPSFNFVNNKTLLWNNTYALVTKTSLSSTNFFRIFLSTSLIVCHQCNLLNIGRRNVFKNIWLVDRYQALSRSQQQGLILYLIYHHGVVTVGGDGGNTLIQDIKGLFNSFTMERFDKWNPQYFVDNMYDLNFYEGDMIHGAGSILFHIHHPTNIISSISFQYITFKRMYHRPQVQYVDQVQLPSIVSSIKNVEQVFFDGTTFFTLSNIEIFDCHYERSNSYFEFEAEVTFIESVLFYNLGYWRLFDEPEWQGWSEVANPTVAFGQPRPMFMISMFYVMQDSDLMGSKNLNYRDSSKLRCCVSIFYEVCMAIQWHAPSKISRQAEQPYQSSRQLCTKIPTCL
ncbi:hypothetical protein FGO68_gene4655 [Halteria grandinella]|uniref:Uncharacterized protein n=1 Tax=Halteria grandinella TaxID=5974 RepID=A0A8J8TAZ1_HALGN|nr:hypothetical protein FGO68_gene4655 [Halteria grandinella]